VSPDVSRPKADAETDLVGAFSITIIRTVISRHNRHILPTRHDPLRRRRVSSVVPDAVGRAVRPFR
jgi:hypothetical protein